MTEIGKPSGAIRWRKKPAAEVDAIQWTGENFGDVHRFSSGAVGIGPVEGGALPLWVVKSSATCRVERGDWIIREPDGSGFYPCAGDIFTKLYEPAGESGTSPALLCPRCLRDGVLEQTLERARAAEAKLAAIEAQCRGLLDNAAAVNVPPSRTHLSVERILAIISGEETGNG
jgi:hypothetical protein